MCVRYPARPCKPAPFLRRSLYRAFPGGRSVAGATPRSATAADGVGTYGRTDDKVVTFFAFGLMAFFTILVIVLSLIQIRLKNRKQRSAKEDLERLGAVLRTTRDQRVGRRG